MRAIVVLALIIAAAIPPSARAQEWLVRIGGAARAEYNDNYFFTESDRQSAFVASIDPFVAAVRRTEVSEITALLAVGANTVWGDVDSKSYFSGRASLDGSLRDARATWSGNVSLSRAASLQSVVTPSGTILALAYTNSATANAAYTYALSESWSLGATASGYSYRYDQVEGNDSFQNNRGYSVGGMASYAFSERTRVTFAPVYSYFDSDVSKSDAVTATLGVVHQFSPQLTVSASIAGYWTKLDPSSPLIEQRRDSGALYGGSIVYDLTERSRFVASLSETLSPGGTGTLTKNDSALLSLSHSFSESLTGRIGASYVRTKFPAALGGSFDNEYYAGEIGTSYRFAERWVLDLGYRYARARYAQTPGQPASNLVFVSIGYNWPGASITEWIGMRSETQGFPGAGPIAPTERGSGAIAPPATLPAPGSMQRSPFDQYFIP